MDHNDVETTSWLLQGTLLWISAGCCTKVKVTVWYLNARNGPEAKYLRRMMILRQNIVGVLVSFRWNPAITTKLSVDIRYRVELIRKWFSIERSRNLNKQCSLDHRLTKISKVLILLIDFGSVVQLFKDMHNSFHSFCNRQGIWGVE